MSDPRIAFKAGRAFRRENTNFVDPSPTKGAIILQNGLEDGLLHFIWRNRVSNENEEDLILFPGDATFIKVSQSAWGRTYVLKFSSSNQRHFFWMQDADPSRDYEFVNNVNRLLTDPESVPIWNAPGYSPTEPSPSSTPVAGPSAAATAHEPTPGELARVRELISSMGGQPQGGRPEFLLQDILTPANLLPLFTSHPEIVPSLFPYLPSDLPSPPSIEVLQQVIASPQFRSAVRSFDIALSTGALQGFVRSLGLPEEAGSGFEAFLRAIQSQAEQEGESSMDTD
ncbi:adhesion regulating molecule [Trametopsis cervina]|nr:adhesion regulating molecule [Trametopsis cervina]